MTAIAATSSSARPAQLAIPTLRAARLDDYPQIERLESSHGLLTLPAEDWRGVWLDNPLRNRLGDDFPFAWVLEDCSGRVVGSMSNIPTLYTFRERELIGVTGRGWVVEPQYRGVALMLMDEYFNQERADLLINTTVNSMAVDPFSAFGSVRVPVGDWETASYWVTSYRGFARAALRIKNVPLGGILSYPAAAALKFKDVVTRARLAPGATSCEISQTHAFDDRFDEFWKELAVQNSQKLLGVRNRRTLSWHFAAPLRSRQLWILTASRNGLLRAYCILKRQDHPPSGLRRMRVVDYQAVEHEEDLLAALLRPALRRCAAEKIHTLEHVGRGLAKMQAFDRGAPYQRKLPAWPFYYFARSAALNADLVNPGVWDPSTYDGDASI